MYKKHQNEHTFQGSPLLPYMQPKSFCAAMIPPQVDVDNFKERTDTQEILTTWLGALDLPKFLKEMDAEDFKKMHTIYLKDVLEGKDKIRKIDLKTDKHIPLWSIEADVSSSFARREVTEVAIRKLFPMLVKQDQWSTGLTNHCAG